MTNPHTFGSDVVDNATDIVADHINNLRAWLAFTAALGLNSNTETLSANKTLIDGDEPVQYIDPSASGFTVELPAEGITNHIFYFVNISISDNLEVKDDGATIIVSILPGMSAILVSDGSSWKLITPEVLDEDDFVSDSNTKVPTQQSVKAYANNNFAEKTQKRVATHIVFDLVGPVPYETGDARGKLPVPAELAGWKLTNIEAFCASCSTKYEIQISNGTNDLLNTKLQIDSGTTHSKDAATQPVINTSYNTMAGGMILDVDADAGVGTGLVIIYTFTGDLD